MIIMMNTIIDLMMMIIFYILFFINKFTWILKTFFFFFHIVYLDLFIRRSCAFVLFSMHVNERSACKSRGSLVCS